MTRLGSAITAAAFATLCVINLVSAKDGFIATFPEILKEGTESQFCLTMYSTDRLAKQASWKMVNKETQELALEESDMYTAGVQKCTTFEVPEAGSYELLVYNKTDILHDTVEVTVQEDQPLILVQTDKPMYKPGQMVKFRILTLFYDMKPRTGEIASVYVIDPDDIRVKQFLSIDNDGMTSLDFQLVDRAKLGRWKIQVNLEEGSKPSETTFEVKEYVLPRFEVTITPPSYILATDELIEGKVCAKYTYGQPVNGFLDLQMWYGQPDTYNALRSSKFTEVVKFSGCYNFSVNASSLISLERRGQRYYSYFYEELQISASVTEAGTAVVVNKTNSGPRIANDPINIQMQDYTQGVFKPGLPYYGKVIVTRPDGTPANGEVITIEASGFHDNSVFTTNFTSNEKGEVVYALCEGLTENTTSIIINAKAVEYERSGPITPYRNYQYAPQTSKSIRQWFSPSLSYIQIPRLQNTAQCNSRLSLSVPFTTVGGSDVTFTYQVLARGQNVKTGQVTYSHMRYPFRRDNYQPAQQYCLTREEPTPTPPTPPTPPVDILDETMEDAESDTSQPIDLAVPLPDGEIGDIEINTSEMDTSQPGEPPIPVPDEDLFTIPPAPEMFKEPVVRSDVLADTVATLELDLDVSTLMSPSFTLLLYHVLPDGEVVADNMEFNVDPCFANQVDLEFNKDTVLPGEDVSVTLNAAPGSLCGVGVVDKSINILGGDHQITKDKVFKKIEELSRAQFRYIPRFYNEDDYCKDRIERLKETPASPDEYWFYTSQYVDAIQAFQSSGFKVLTNLDIETRPCEQSYPIFYAYSGRRGGDGGPMPMPEVMQRRGGAVNGLKAPKIRTNFPETWLWDLTLVGEDGEAVIEEKAPDTITSWVGNAVCLDENQGFGVSEMTSLTTFQPFFLSLQLPYSAVRDERMPAILTVYNYLQKCVKIRASLDVGQDITLSGNSGFEEMCLCAGQSDTVRYYLSPNSIGHLNITAKAAVVDGTCGDSMEMDTDYIGYTDGVRRQLLVKAEGTPQGYTHTTYICSKRDEGVTENVVLPLPDNVVKDSARGEVKIIGDIMGPVMNNLENLVRMPTGCGEQNMVGFVPNIWVLKYLTNTGRLTDDIEAKATKHMEIGYQRELTYRHDDGSYSAFGKSDERGSVWLTAFVVKSFSQAMPYIFVDEKEMDRSVQFLRKSQLENGCFRETGKVLSSFMMGGLAKGKKKESLTAISAYVLSALLRAGVSENEPVIIEGMKCINRDLRSEKNKMDPYSLALVAYVNTMYKPHSQESSQLIKTLNAKSKNEGALRYWSRETPKPPSVNTWYYYAAPSAEVEMTSYALLAFLNFYGEESVEQTHDIAMWLSQQRNPQGGFSSTQDTVIGLQALSEFASLAYSDEGSDLTIGVSGEGLDSQFEVSDLLQNTLLLQSEPIHKIPNQLRIETNGVGCALIQASVSYNKPADKLLSGTRPAFYLKVMTRDYQFDTDRCDRKTLKIIVRLRNRKFSTGMSLMTVKMVTSWSPVKESLLRLESQFPALGIKLYEYKEDEGLLTFYFDELTRKPKEIALDVEQDRETKVSNPQPADVKVYQYYETDVAAVRAYKLKTICGTKLEIPHKIPEVMPDWPVQFRVDLSDVPTNRAAAPAVNRSCPVCSDSKAIPSGLDRLVCRSAAIYKGVAGRKGKKPLKLREDFRTPDPEKVNSFANYALPEGCDCSMLKPKAKKVFIFASQKLSRKTLTLDALSVVLPGTKKMEKNILKYLDDCINT